MIQSVSLGHGEAQQAISAIQAELARRGKAAVVAVADARLDFDCRQQDLDGGPRAQVQPRARPGGARSTTWF